MAILQAIISLISRSASSALNAIFGWAVLALFGQTSQREKTLFSALVGAAGIWPILVLGIFIPKIALFVVSFVPLAGSVPSIWLRIIWIVLALFVPVVIGLVLAKRAPKESLPEPWWKKVLRGFPITVALACALLLMLVIAPTLKIVSVATGREIVHLPAVLKNKQEAHAIMEALAASLHAQGVEVVAAKPPWRMTAPSRVLLKLGGRAFAHMVSQKIEYRRNERLELAIMPNEALVRGKPEEVARTRAVSVEVYAQRDVSQTFDPVAQDIEQQIKRVWAVYRESPDSHTDSRALTSRVSDLAANLARSNLPWDEWQTNYSLLLQLDHALHGGRPLLTGEVQLTEEHVMETQTEKTPLGKAVPLSVESLSNRELISHISDTAVLLVRKEIELAQAEIKENVRAEVATAKGLGVAGVCTLLAASMLLVTLALGLGEVMAGWLAALIISAVLLTVATIAGLIGWGKRVKTPLDATRRTLKGDAQWIKERLA